MEENEDLIQEGSLDDSNINDTPYSNLDEYCIKNVCPILELNKNDVSSNSIFTHPILILFYIIIVFTLIYTMLTRVKLFQKFSIKISFSQFIFESLKITGILISLYLSIKGLQTSIRANKSAIRAEQVAEQVSRNISRIESRNAL